jgi:CelD/BcsL family acetyltransferase involved in cellulose biosynthesis
MPLDWQTATSFEELGCLSSAWLNLWRVSGQTPFQSPMWLIPWLRKFCADNWTVITIHEEEELIAVIPFYFWKDPHSGERRLLLAGNGISDHLDACLDPNRCGELHEILKHCLHEIAGWDTCEFNQLPQDSILHQLDFDRTAALLEGDACPVLSLENGFEGIPKRQREKLRYYRNRIGKTGRWEITQAGVETVRPTLDSLFSLHELRWRERAEPGVLENETVRAFHLEAAANLARVNALRLYTLGLDGAVIGVLYAFVGGKRTCFYLSGFDPAHEKLSPGTLLIGHAIEQAIHDGCDRFDFLRGTEPYKYSWGAIDERAFRFIAHRSSSVRPNARATIHSHR